VRNTADDDSLPPEKRRELLLKKLARWHRDPSGHRVSAGKLVKLRRLMRELSIEDPRAGELRDAVRVMEVMES